MGSVERIRLVAERIAGKAQKGARMVVVVSAMADTTDDLIDLMHKVSLSPDRKEIDQMMATGEMVSASLAASALQNLGIRARSFNAFNLHLLSEMQGEEYNIVQIGRRNQLARFLEPGSVAVVAGFQGITSEGDLTTLGRGGSDLTAVVLARDLGQKVCEKYTDEDGIYTADPRIIPSARKVWHLNYEEMMQLADYGNGILHPRAISCAKESEIRIHVRSSFTNAEGSVVGPDGEPDIPIKSITSESKSIIVKIHGIKKPDEVFAYQLNKKEFKPLLMQWLKFNELSGSLRIAFRRQDAFDAIPFCWEQAHRLKAEEVVSFSNLKTVSLVGCGVSSVGIEPFRKALEDVSIVPVVTQQDKFRLSFAIEKEKASAAIEALHKTLIERVKFSS